MRGGLALIGLLSLALLAPPVATEAQQRGKAPRIGFLRSTAPVPAEFEAFREGLRAFGYVERQSIVIEQRHARGALGRLPGLAAELVRLRVSVIVVDDTISAHAAHGATKTIPIVFTLPDDPVASGLVASLARPGGTMTGISQVSTQLNAERVQLLKDAMPDITRIALLHNSSQASQQVRETQAAAHWLALQVQIIEVRSPGDWADAFAAMERGGAQALVVLPDAIVSSQRKQVARLTAKSRLPTMFPDREFVDAGGLMSFAPKKAESFRRAAAYVDRILRGAVPADLPVEQPSHFELVINLRTAKALRLKIPEPVLSRADHVIQ